MITDDDFNDDYADDSDDVRQSVGLLENRKKGRKGLAPPKTILDVQEITTPSSRHDPRNKRS